MPVRPKVVLGDERGQAMVELGLLLFPLVLIVVALVQIGVAVNFWQDQQRLANQGARFAIVNCSGSGACKPSLEAFLESQTLSSGNRPTPTVCFESKSGPGGTAVIGDPVSVRLESPFTFVPILGIGKVTLSAEATMRLEQDATHPGIVDEPEC